MSLVYVNQLHLETFLNKEADLCDLNGCLQGLCFLGCTRERKNQLRGVKHWGGGCVLICDICDSKTTSTTEGNRSSSSCLFFFFNKAVHLGSILYPPALHRHLYPVLIQLDSHSSHFVLFLSFLEFWKCSFFIVWLHTLVEINEFLMLTH